MPNLYKSILIVWAIFGYNQFLQAQSMKQSVIATGGGSSNSISGYIIDFTVGETVIKTGSSSQVINTSSIACTQGFQQPLIAKDFPNTALTLHGTPKSTNILLNWITHTETNNDVFYIERSNDGITYTVTGVVATKAPGGNSTTELQYTFSDLQPVNGNNYYRLRQVSKTNNISYSNTVVIPFILPDWSVHVYPNPIQNNEHLKLYTNEKAGYTLRLVNMMGQLLFVQRITAEKGYNDFTINMTGLKAGMYIMFIQNDIHAGRKKTIKLIKQ